MGDQEILAQKSKIKKSARISGRKLTMTLIVQTPPLSVVKKYESQLVTNVSYWLYIHGVMLQKVARGAFCLTSIFGSLSAHLLFSDQYD